MIVMIVTNVAILALLNGMKLILFVVTKITIGIIVIVIMVNKGGKKIIKRGVIMNCSNPDCNKPLKSELEQYGDVDKPICFDCHMKGLKYCELCVEWTVHSLTAYANTGGYCDQCNEIVSSASGQIMDDIRVVEDDLQRQYMQAKLLDFCKG